MGISLYSMKWRRIIHKPLIAVVRLFLKRKVTLVQNSFQQNQKPTVFAFTHVFFDDIATALSCLRCNAYVLMANREGLMKTANGIALLLNGVIWIDRGDKDDRARSLEKMKTVLRRRGNVLIAPEANWNLSPNLPVLKMWWGLLDAAESAGANIVPVAIDIVGGSYAVKIGESFDYARYRDKADAIEALRDVMATMAWELFEMKPRQKRSEITEGQWVSFIKNELARAPFLNQATEESFTYRPKGEISLDELLADMHGIEYKSMAADYEQYRRVEALIKNWNKPMNMLWN